MRFALKGGRDMSNKYDELFDKLEGDELEETRSSVIDEVVKARHQKGISQKKLEELSGVQQPVIARMEKGRTNPTLDTVLKALAPLGMTLKVVKNDEQ